MSFHRRRDNARRRVREYEAAVKYAEQVASVVFIKHARQRLDAARKEHARITAGRPAKRRVPEAVHAVAR